MCPTRTTKPFNGCGNRRRQVKRSPEEIRKISNDIQDIFAPNEYKEMEENKMKAEPWIYGLAKQMLGEEELDPNLHDYLGDIETFASLANGSVQSRQVVALALVYYLDRKTLMKKIMKLEHDIEKLKGLED